MRISKIGVYGLFNQFNHDIQLNPEERITIMIGPNGFGKTMILRILDALFTRSVGSLEAMPFEQLSISFDDGSILNVQRKLDERGSRTTRGKLFLEYKRSASARKSDKYETTGRVSEDDIPFPINAIDDFIPQLRQIGPEEWMDIRTNQVLDLEAVIRDYSDELPLRRRIPEGRFRLPAWLEEMRGAIPVRFIGIERLTHPTTYSSAVVRPRRELNRFSPERTVIQYSQDLADRVQRTLTEYGTLSQALDRTFPTRLVEEPTTPVPSVDVLRVKLSEVEEKRSRFVEAGLLAQQDEDLRVPVIASVDESKRGVLAVYAEDALTKLGVFDDLYNRVNALKRIANDRFIYKRVSVSTRGLEVAGWDGSRLDLEMLSSGEQHELVLLYDLLFGITENSLILIDEPELSLHVAWQDEILSDLQEMAGLSNFRVLLATHSPQIIRDRWDLTVELTGPNVK